MYVLRFTQRLNSCALFGLALLGMLMVCVSPGLARITENRTLSLVRCNCTQVGRSIRMPSIGVNDCRERG